MNTRRTLRRVGLLAGTSLLALAAIGPAASPTLAKPSGSIWTTNETCENPAAQNDNHYAVGEVVYIRGSNFAVSTAFSWTVTGKPGGASGDPNQEVGSGSSTTDSAGAFCVAGYTVAADDWGEYSVDVEQGNTRKNDNYRVDAATGDEATDDPSDDPSDNPGDEATDDPSDNPGDEATDDPSDDPSDDPGDEVTDDPADDPTNDANLPTKDANLPTDDANLPTDDANVPTDDANVPTDDANVPTDDANLPTDDANVPNDDANLPTDEGPAQDPVDTSDDDDAGYPPSDVLTQEVLGAVGGPTLTPPPTDSLLAPPGQTGGSDWRLIVAGLGFLIMAATMAIPSRRRTRA